MYRYRYIRLGSHKDAKRPTTAAKLLAVKDITALFVASGLSVYSLEWSGIVET